MKAGIAGIVQVGGIPEKLGNNGTTSYCSPDEVRRNAECLLGHIEAVQGYLRGKGFSEHAIDHAVTVVYRAAMPYITGTRICRISDRRGWVFKVAFRAAKRAARREVRCCALEPAIVAAPVSDAGDGQALFDLGRVLNQLTEQQRAVVELCWLEDVSQRAAAKSLGIAVGTLCKHLKAAKQRLTEILAAHENWLEHRFQGGRARLLDSIGEKST